MREKLTRFMIGRYGVLDAFSKFLLGISILLLAISWISDYRIFGLLAAAVIVLLYYRTLSRKIYRRSYENQEFLNRTRRIRTWFQKRKYNYQQRKIYHIYKCPDCKQKIRIPRGRGRIQVTCPKCGKTFIKDS